MKGLRLTVAGAIIASALALAAPAAASRPTASFYFYDCQDSGLTSFWAVKTALPPAASAPVSAAGAFLLEDGSVFVVLSFGEGNFDPPGIRDSAAVTTTCLIDFIIGTTTVYGHFATH